MCEENKNLQSLQTLGQKVTEKLVYKFPYCFNVDGEKFVATLIDDLNANEKTALRTSRDELEKDKKRLASALLDQRERWKNLPSNPLYYKQHAIDAIDAAIKNLQ